MTVLAKTDILSEKILENLISSKMWLTAKETAIYLGTSPAGIRNRRWRGQLKSYKYQGRLYFKRSDLDRQIEFSGKGG